MTYDPDRAALGVNASLARGHRRLRVGTTAVFFANGMALALFFSSIPLLKSQLELSDAGLGTALGAQGLGTVIFVVIGSLVATRLGTRGTMFLGAVLFLAATQYMGLGVTASVVVPAMFALGATNSFVDVSMNTHASLVERKYGREIMASFHAAYNFGGFAGAALVAFIVKISETVYVPLAVAGIAQIVVIVLAWRLMGNLRPGAEHKPHDKRSGSWSVLRSMALFTLGVFVALSLFVENGVNGWSGVYLSDVVMADASTAAMAFGAFQLTMAIGRLIGARAIMYLGVGKVIAFGSLTGALGVLLAVIVPTEVMAIIGFGLVGLGLANLTPMFFSRAAAAIPSAPALGIALVNTLGYVGYIAGPLLLGLVAEWLGLKIAFLLILGAFAMVAAGSRLVVVIRPSADLVREAEPEESVRAAEAANEGE